MRSAGATARAAWTTCSISAAPPAPCRTLARFDRILVPRPAARITTVVFIISRLPSFYGLGQFKASVSLKPRCGASVSVCACRRACTGGGEGIGLLRSFALARLFFFVVDGNLFQVLGFENVAAIEAGHVIDPVAPRQKLNAGMFAGRHGVAWCVITI